MQQLPLMMQIIGWDSPRTLFSSRDIARLRDRVSAPDLCRLAASFTGAGRPRPTTAAWPCCLGSSLDARPRGSPTGVCPAFAFLMMVALLRHRFTLRLGLWAGLRTFSWPAG
eukprot:11220072-Alexandrium_andersonii.AAC.2